MSMQDDEGELLGLEDDTDAEGAGLPSRREEDGGVTVDTGDGQPSNRERFQEHYENLVEAFPPSFLAKLGIEYLELADRFRRAREERDKQYEEGIKRSGLGKDAPGGADFEGASRAVHPMLTDACIDFAARAIKEIMPSGVGPVKDYVTGKQDRKKLEKAKRKTDYMNWQMTRQVPEFRIELHKLFSQLGMGGSQYLCISWDRQAKCPRPSFIPIDYTILPPSATSWKGAAFKGFIDHVTRQEFEKRCVAGEYVCDDIAAPASLPEETASQKASARVEGKTQDPYNSEGEREVYNFFVLEDFSEQIEGGDRDGDLEYPHLPYLVQVDFYTKMPVGIYRNWKPDDDKFQPIGCIAEFTFVPWRGPYGIGFPHMIGGLSAAATGALRALLDSGHINNIPSGIKIKGVTTGGQNIRVQPGEIAEVEADPTIDDIRKLAMPFPFNPPSPVLFNLLGFLTDAAKAVVRTTLQEAADSNQNVPVGTTLARLEQGMVVYSSILGGLHTSFNDVLMIIHTLNSIWLDDETVIEEMGELTVKRSDFEGVVDVIPVSDPNVYSDAQRVSHAQVIVARSASRPDLYDGRKVEEYLLDRLNIPGGKDCLVERPEPKRLNAVNENVAAVAGRPLSAFPDQDHLAHMQVHLEFIEKLGMNPLLAPSYLPAVLSHLKEHIAFLYVSIAHAEASHAAGQDITDLMPDDGDAVAGRDYDEMLVPASGIAVDKTVAALARAMPVIEKAMQMVQQMQQPPLPQDPAQAALARAAQVRAEAAKESNVIRMQDVQGRAQERQAKLGVEQQREQRETARLQMEAADSQADRLARAAEVLAQEEGDSLREAAKQEGEDRRAAAANATKVATNTQDNQTALVISEAEIEAGNKSNLSTGTGINPKGQ